MAMIAGLPVAPDAGGLVVRGRAANRLPGHVPSIVESFQWIAVIQSVATRTCAPGHQLRGSTIR
jgi:hypothetical protein